MFDRIIDSLHNQLMKLIAFAFVAAGAAVFISILSHNPADPSFNNATSAEPTNLIGGFGAHLADLLLQFFGYASPLYTLILLMWAYRFYQGLPVTKFWFRILMSVVAVSCLASFLAIFESSGDASGGVVGSFAKSWLYLNLTQPIYNAMFFVSFIISMHFASGLRLREEKEFYEKMGSPFRAIFAKIFAIAEKETKHKVKRVKFQREMREQKDRVEPTINVADRRITPAPQADAKPKRAAKAAKQASLQLGEMFDDFELPPIELMREAPHRYQTARMSETALSQNAKILEGVLTDFSVKGEISRISPGPVVTLYEFLPAAGIKSSRVIGLADDIARSMSAVSARIATIPGQNAMGIELPNSKRETVYLREMIESDDFKNSGAKLPMALGKDIGGLPVIADLAKMPHLLVAGTTGSGKSVAINTMILSLLYRLPPSQCKFIMIDPKMLELSVYDGIPHLLAPVVTEPGKAVVALKWVVKEMENRYRLMSTLGVRNLDGYNARMEEAISKGETMSRNVQTGFDPETGKPIIENIPIEMAKFPYIVVIVDEMADLMLVAGKDIEASIQRLAQMARAAGIHIIMATQRPSVDVITGVIKANFPTRISFQVTSKIDSRTILGEQGAEQLLGQGDMLYMAGGGRVSRVHGPFVEDREVEKVVSFLKTQGAPSYIEDVTKEEDPVGDDMLFDEGDGSDDEGLYRQAVQIVVRDKKASTSYVQRKLRIGYNRAAILIERMEEEGVISAPNHAGKREILHDAA